MLDIGLLMRRVIVVGLAFLWKNERGIQIKDDGTHFIDFEVENEQVGR